MLQVQIITKQKERFLPLLEQSGVHPDRIKEKLASCDLYVLSSGSITISAVLIEVKDTICDIVAIATEASHRKQGYAARLVEYVAYDYSKEASLLQIRLPKASVEPFYRLGFHAEREENNLVIMKKDLKELD